MGLLSDFFVADPGDAARYGTESPDRRRPEVVDLAEFKGLTNLQIEILWSMLEGREWDSAAHGLAYIEIGDENGPWLFRFPTALVARIAALNLSDISAVAPRWAETEELSWEPDEAQEVIDELVRLSRRAVATGKGLFLWVSL